jgi:hypothetical protein
MRYCVIKSLNKEEFRQDFADRISACAQRACRLVPTGGAQAWTNPSGQSRSSV